MSDAEPEMNHAERLGLLVDLDLATSMLGQLKPEDMAATIYRSLGIPPTASWLDAADRPHFIYHGDPIAGLT